MKDGKDEEKSLDPLFPRLHINDADKGGPRPPPRNKMASFQQLSIPSPKFTSGTTSFLPLPPNSSTTSVPSASSSHKGCHERNLFSTVCNFSGSNYFAERLSSDASNLNIKSTNDIWQQPTSYPTLSAGRRTTMSKWSLFQPHSFSKNSSVKKLGDEDGFRVPTVVLSRKNPNSGNGQQNMDKEKLTSSGQNSGKFQTSCEKHLKGTDTIDLKSSYHLNHQTEMKAEVPRRAKKPCSILLTGDQILADESACLLGRGMSSEPSNRALVSFDTKKSSCLVDELNRLCDPNAQLRQEYRVQQDNNAIREGVTELEMTTRKRSASTMDGISCSTPALGDVHKSLEKLETVIKGYKDQNCGSLLLGYVERNDRTSDTSAVDSTLGFNISPDEAVGVIGQKQFWEARRTIIHHQRVFTVQVFELHRLIKVQRLIAGSTELLVEDNLYFGRPSFKLPPVKNLPSEDVLKPPPSIVKPKVDTRRPNPGVELIAENAIRNLPTPLNYDSDRELVSRQSNYMFYSGTPTLDSDAKSGSWCFLPPLGNQWLVSLKSPSEGFVYKPYTALSTPTTGFVAPGYGACGPMSLAPVNEDFLNTAYGVPGSYSQGIGIFSGPAALCQTFFPPYIPPAMKPSCSSSSIEQLSLFSANSSERTQGVALPLFPTTPRSQVSDQPGKSHSTEQRVEVIKVVPHNPKSASESAARIFRYIQEERKQHV